MTHNEACRLWPDAVCHTPADGLELKARTPVLIRRGIKTATCEGWDRAVQDGLPRSGPVDLAIDWQGRPALATGTLRVDRITSDAMYAARVVLQGEFRDPDDWRAGYRVCLSRSGAFAPDMAMMAETFAVAQDFQLRSAE